VTGNLHKDNFLPNECVLQMFNSCKKGVYLYIQ